jgi:hypothetical protein
MPISRAILDQFPAIVFFETGTHQGDGVQCALDSGFDLIYTCEINPVSFGYCVHRFVDQRTKVSLHNEDSRSLLLRVLPTITTKVTFWLDAHSCEDPLPGGNDDPLLEELAIISEHPLKNHNILIDDIRNLGTPRLKASVEAILAALAKINPGYQINLLHSPDYPFDILAAHL